MLEKDGSVKSRPQEPETEVKAFVFLGDGDGKSVCERLHIPSTGRKWREAEQKEDALEMGHRLR